MLFNSFEFLAFLCIVLPVYFFLKHLRRQNYWLLAASYFFYGCWDWRFLSLIVISTLNDYFCAKGIDRAQTPARRRIFLWLSIGVNLGILGFFKYYGFFVGSLTDLLGVFHITFHPKLLDVILPMGISFYTFQTMSYTIDVYQRKYPASHRFLDFALYVAFFPQLVAGPIERAHRLLHQIETPRCFSSTQFKEGCYLIYLGLFQKVFVADNLARIVNPVFAVNGDQNGALVLIAVYAFAFQIFCDFAGYTNIARGVAKLFGFELMLNFNLPYLAKNPQDFWRRWHISLSTWLRDYLYIPLGGSRLGPWRNLRNLVLVMALGGLWHGAAWTFVIWGLYHGLLLAGHRVIIAIKKPAAHDGMPVRWLKTLAFFMRFVSAG